MNFDVIVIGAGAAGMMCAAQAGQRGRHVLLIDHAAKIGERIRIGRLVSIDATRPTVRVRYVRWKNANLAVTIIPR